MVLAGGGREGKHTSELQRRQREARMKLSMRNGSTLMRPTISLPLSFFVVGAGGGSLTTKEGRMVWFGGRGRGEVPGYIGTRPHHRQTHGRCRRAGAYLVNVLPNYQGMQVLFKME